MLLSTFFLCLSPNNYTHKPSEMETLLLANAFGDLDPNFIAEFSNGQPLTRICHWGAKPSHYHVTCEGGALTELNILDVYPGNVNIAYLPPTVKDLVIVHADQSYSVDTRLLPKSATDIQLQNNDIFGSINLRTLPIHLESMDLGFNQISGCIDLTHLPPKLFVLRLYNNAFKQQVVYYDNLPEGIFCIALGGNRIRQARSIHGEPSDIAERCMSGVITV